MTLCIPRTYTSASWRVKIWTLAPSRSSQAKGAGPEVHLGGLYNKRDFEKGFSNENPKNSDKR